MQSPVTSRRDEIIKLRRDGLTYAEIGRRFGITKERVRQILTPKPPKPATETALQSKLMLRTGEAASLLGIHTNTLRRWSEKGLIRAHRISLRGDRRFRREDIDSFLKEIAGNPSDASG